MKELDEFTVERLTVLSVSENLPEVAALARIALAAKTAEPVAYLTWHQGCRAPDDCEDYLNAHTHKTEEKSCDGTDAFPVYAAPALNSPGIPEGWRLVPIEATDSMIDAGCDAQKSGFDDFGVFITNIDEIYKTMLAAAPKQEK